MKFTTSDMMAGIVLAVTTKRDYGPYLDNRPILPAGGYDAVVTGLDSFSGQVGSLDVFHNGHKYDVLPEDCKVHGILEGNDRSTALSAHPRFTRI